MSGEQVFALDEALARVDGDEELFMTLAALLVEQGPQDMAVIQACLAAGDAAGLVRAAHKLKGALIQFCAPRAIEEVRRLEDLGHQGDLVSAGAACSSVERELRRLIEALQTILAKGRLR